MAVVVVAVVMLVAAVLQVFGDVAVRRHAVAPAWPRAMSDAAAVRIDALGERLPLLGPLRLARARALLAAGDVAGAAREAERLPVDSGDRRELLAAVARARGDVATAAREDAAAGDLAGLAADVEALVARGDQPAALAAQRLAIARIAARGVDLDALAQARFRLGGLEETRAYQWGDVRNPHRVAHERLAYAAYAGAVALAPLAERYVLAQANQALNLGDYAAAGPLFVRARALDPHAVDPIVGQGDLAARVGDLALARRRLADARALAPADPAVARLAAEIAAAR